MAGSDGRELSTTMAFVRYLTDLLRNKDFGERIVPIIPDEARTFGMEALFRQYGIYAPFGQLYEPVDSASLLYYREEKKWSNWKKALMRQVQCHRLLQRDKLFIPWSGDDSILHLLFNVWLSAYWRFGLVSG